jgi:cell shape-determining protein MreC
MEILKIFKQENIELVVIGVVFLIVIFLVLKDFNMTSKKSWGLLLGLTALGGIIAFRAITKYRLLKELEDREHKLEEIEENYEALRKNNKILDEDYNKLKGELDQVKKDSYKAIMESDARIEAARKESENYKNITREEVYDFLKTF